jgi:hypothetical protein
VPESHLLQQHVPKHEQDKVSVRELAAEESKERALETLLAIAVRVLMAGELNDSHDVAPF